jgi:hypothetical protein
MATKVKINTAWHHGIGVVLMPNVVVAGVNANGSTVVPNIGSNRVFTIGRLQADLPPSR